MLGKTVRLAGTFQPTADQMAMAEQMRALGTELFQRAQVTGQLRPGITWLDVEYLLELLARVKLGNAERTAELRQRHLAVIIDGLHTTKPTLDHPLTRTWQQTQPQTADQQNAPVRGGIAIPLTRQAGPRVTAGRARGRR